MFEKGEVCTEKDKIAVYWRFVLLVSLFESRPCIVDAAMED